MSPPFYHQVITACLCGAQLRCHKSNKAVHGQDRTGHGRTGQDRTGQDRTGQERCVWICVGIEIDRLVYVGRGESETDAVMST